MSILIQAVNTHNPIFQKYAPKRQVNITEILTTAIHPNIHSTVQLPPPTDTVQDLYIGQVSKEDPNPTLQLTTTQHVPKSSPPRMTFVERKVKFLSKVSKAMPIGGYLKKLILFCSCAAIISPIVPLNIAATLLLIILISILYN